MNKPTYKKYSTTHRSISEQS